MGSEEEFLSDEMVAAVQRYEKMMDEATNYYFDVHEFEKIFDYYFGQKRYKLAKEVLALGMTQHPGAISLFLKEAQILVEKGKAKEALAKIALVESVDSSNETVFLLKGSAYLIMADYDTAQRFYEKAIELSEEPEDWVLNIAYTFERIGKFDRAIYFLQKYLDKNPDNEDILWELAVFHEQNGDDEKALKTYRKFIDINPFSDAGWFNMGVILNQMEQYDEAIESFDYVLAINPDFTSALFNKGNTLANLDKHEEAIQTYSEFLLKDENHAQTLTYIGESYEKLNNNTMAYQYYRKARAADPSFSEPWYGLASIMLQKENPYEALYYIRKAIQLKSGNPDYLFLLGKVNMKLEFFEDALSAFQDVLKLDPTDDESRQMIEKLKSENRE
jgi:tetratricopeptide (TPR) repeat protein